MAGGGPLPQPDLKETGSAGVLAQSRRQTLHAPGDGRSHQEQVLRPPRGDQPEGVGAEGGEGGDQPPSEGYLQSTTEEEVAAGEGFAHTP